MSTTFRMTLSPAHISADLCPIGLAFFFCCKKIKLKTISQWNRSRFVGSILKLIQQSCHDLYSFKGCPANKLLSWIMQNKFSCRIFFCFF